MSECLQSIGDVLVNRCVDFTIGETTYISKLRTNFDELESELGRLLEKRSDLRSKVDKEERHPKRRLQTVQGWFSRVETLERDIGKLRAERARQLDKLCLGGYCSKRCVSSYKFGKQVVEMLNRARTLKEEGNFTVVAEEIPEQAVEKSLGPTIIGQESILGEIWRCLTEEEIGIVGVYGMAGTGKTTLLNQIYNKFLDALKDDDDDDDASIIIWVDVSKEPQPDKIQEEIWRKIDVLDDSWKASTTTHKASDITRNLIKKKFVLLLDDVWERVDLSRIGVPMPSTKDGSKIIFTTRSLSVCERMRAQRKFKMDCLQNVEAVKLFKEMIGADTLSSHWEIPGLAEEMARECYGLPLALVTVAQAMAGTKTPEAWMYHVEMFRRSASHFPGMEKEVFPLLKQSYDHLPEDTARYCLLYCGLFPKGHPIDKDQLIDSWIGEGFFDCHNHHSGEDELQLATYHRGHDIIGVLVGACLLEEVEEEAEEERSYVKPHPIIRDMVMWIGSRMEERNILVVRVDERSGKLPDTITWEQEKRISLMQNPVDRLQISPKCPHLLALFLNSNRRLREISDDFFLNMPSLRVLNLSYNINLFRFPSGIEKLISLRHLDLSYTNIRTLPEELKCLVNLRCLNLEHMEVLEEVPRGLFSYFAMIHVLRTFACGYTFLWSAGELVEELHGLKHLKVLTMTLKSSEALQEFLRYDTLKGCTRSLLLYRFDGSSLDVLALTDLDHLKKLRITWCTDLEEMMIDSASGVLTKTLKPLGLLNLQTVQIEKCKKLRDLTWLVFAPNLKHISVFRCSGLKEIISSDKFETVPEAIRTQIPFAKLQCIDLRDLELLNNIYQKALPFPDLKEIRVSNCPALKKLPLESSRAKGRKFVINGTQIWWNNLQWEEDQATRHDFQRWFKANDQPSPGPWQSEQQKSVEAKKDVMTGVVRFEQQTGPSADQMQRGWLSRVEALESKVGELEHQIEVMEQMFVKEIQRLKNQRQKTYAEL